MNLLDPKNALIFKKLFAEAPDLLPALINAVRSEEAPIRVVEVLNPRIAPEELAGKFIVLDLLAQDGAGRRYNIEMQVRLKRPRGLSAEEETRRLAFVRERAPRGERSELRGVREVLTDHPGACQRG